MSVSLLSRRYTLRRQDVAIRTGANYRWAASSQIEYLDRRWLTNYCRLPLGYEMHTEYH